MIENQFETNATQSGVGSKQVTGDQTQSVVNQINLVEKNGQARSDLEKAMSEQQNVDTTGPTRRGGQLDGEQENTIGGNLVGQQLMLNGPMQQNVAGSYAVNVGPNRFGQ